MVSSTIRPDCEVALNSKNSRDLPTPASAIAATICPCPDLACAAACLRASISRSRPTNLVNPRPAERCKRVRNGPSPVTSYTLTGSASPLIFDLPRASSDRADHDFAGVHTDSNLNRSASFGTLAVGVAADFLLHPQRRIERALRMVLMRNRRAEQREDAVARRLHHVAVVTMGRIDHQLQRRVDDRARFLGVEVAHQLGG